MKIIVPILIIWSSLVASAQVKVNVPKPHYKSHDRIDVGILNTGTSDVTVCMEYGYVSFIDSEHSEATPTPVYVQQKNLRRWETLLTVPDIGSSRHSFILHTGEIQRYPFRITAHGTVRIVLEYRLGFDENFCVDHKGTRIARSHEFSLD